MSSELGTAQPQLVYSIVKTQSNSTQLNATLKQLALELGIVVTVKNKAIKLFFKNINIFIGKTDSVIKKGGS